MSQKVKNTLFTLAFGAAISAPALADTVFVAGATGVVGRALVPILVQEGHKVYGTTRSAEKAKLLEQQGAKAVVVDVFDKAALEKAVVEAKPDVVISQLSDLPKGLPEAELEAGLKRDAKIRIEGTRNLIAAAEKAGVKTFIAQSHIFAYAPSDKPWTEDSPFMKLSDAYWGETVFATRSLEEQVLDGKFIGVALRYGWLYGAGTGFDDPIPDYPSLSTTLAAKATIAAMKAKTSGVYNVAEANPQIDVSKFNQAFPNWAK